MASDPTPEELALARKVAWEVGSRWSSVEIEDVQSELYLWLYSHRVKLARWREAGRGNGALYITLRREALKVCTKEAAAKKGAPLTWDEFYTEQRVMDGLPFIYEAWPETTVREDPQTGKVLDRPADFSNALAIMADLRGAYAGLPLEMREVLDWRFRDGMTLEWIAKQRDLSKEGARKLVQRCVLRICQTLSGIKN